MRSCPLVLVLLAVLLACPACGGTATPAERPILGTEADLDLLAATRTLKERLQASPNEPRLIEALANVYARRGLFEESIHTYRKLTLLEPENAPAWHNLALVYERQGLLREARAAAEAAGAAAPQEQFYAQESGRLAALQRDAESGERAFTSQLSETYEALKRTDPDALTTAAALAEDLLARWPEQAEAWNVAGVIAMKQREVERAKSHFDTAIERDPRTLQARYNRAMLAWDEGDTKTTDAQFAAIANLLPDSDDRARTYIRALREDLAAGKKPAESRVMARGLE